ncbi:lysophospholipase II [Exophiala viscosa]|uniref:lysophospholipase II n=1 Tax=Exophiala viscosa TaxID=2486360 RepID=UPI0021973E67|nr:lysophospholipase II [Exophiala viscosa]
MSSKPPYILPPAAPSVAPDRAATIIFLHGYGDDAEGLPLGLAQQFHFYNKMQWLKWVLPNAEHNHDAMERAWYMPKALPNAMKPRVPGHEDDKHASDDEAGIIKSVDYVDKLVEEEIGRGTPPERILVGGFSQGCAVSLTWGLTGRFRHKVGGMVCLSGYFPLSDRIESLREERSAETSDEAAVPEKGVKKWFYVHGTRDMLVPSRLYSQGIEELSKWVDKADIEEHLYEGMGHSTSAAELRDLLGFFEKVIPQ